MGGVLGLLTSLSVQWIDVDTRLHAIDQAIHDQLALVVPGGTPANDPIVVVTVKRDGSGQPLHPEFDARVQELTKQGATCIVDRGLPLGRDVGWVGRLVVSYDSAIRDASPSASPPPPSLPIYGELPTPLAIARPTEWASSTRARLGAPLIIPDADGVVRRMPLIARIDETIVPNLAIAAGLSLYHESSLQFGNHGTQLLSFARVDVPLDRDGYQRLCFRGSPPSFRTLLLDRSPPPEWSNIDADSVVIFSSNETVETPVASAMTRGEVIATSLDNLMRGNTLREESAWLEAILQAAISIGVGATIFAGRHVVVTLLCVATAIAIPFAMAYTRFLDGVLFPVTPPLTATILVAVGISIGRGVARRVRRPAALESSREPSATE